MSSDRPRHDDEIDRLMDWAEEEETDETEYSEDDEDEPCESDIANDRVGLPGGTSDSDEELSADYIDDESESDNSI